jgi:trigger factor
MQVTQLSAEGLRRQFKVVVPADDIEGRIQGRLRQLSQTVRMPGFRPGKVPQKLLRRQYGRSIMGEILEEAVNQGSQQAIRDNELRPALQPKVEVNAFDEGKDLEFTVNVEVLPETPEVDIGALSLTRPVAPIGDEEIERAIERLARREAGWEEPEEGRLAAEQDRVTISFEGRVDGEPFEGGSAEEVPVVIGSGSMIPGFEEQLRGAVAGSEREVKVTLPERFPKEELVGKEATFQVQVKEVREPKPASVDDAFAQRIGAESLEALRKAVRERMEADYRRVSRDRVKRQLLDRLAERYHFQVPEGMVELEFEAIWKQLQQELERSGGSLAEADKPEEELRAEYRAIAERRVRLGLLLSEIGRRNQIKVEPHEINAAVVEQARRFPGQEQKVVEFFRENPQAVEQLKAPLFEDKVVDFILQLAKVEDQAVTAEELFRDPDDEAPPVPAADRAAGEAAAADPGPVRE